MLNSARELKFPRYPLFAGENMIRSPRPREGVLIHPQTTARTTDHECFDAAPPSLPQGANRRQVAVTSEIRSLDTPQGGCVSRSIRPGHRSGPPDDTWQ